jgi:dihydroflavonol-4-reductase
MRALVTGGTGLVGASIVRELLKDGVEVRAMVREKSDTRNLDGLDIARVNGDIRDAASMEKALKGIDVFYQAAALYATSGMPEKLFYDINVEGTKTALNAALKAGVPKVVYTSSIAAVGWCESPDKPVDEKTEFNAQSLDLPYVQTKYQGELAALEFVRKGLPVVVVNPAMVIGVRDIKPTPSGQMIVNILNGKYPVCPAGGASFVDVEDVARGHILAAQKGKIGERYILGTSNMSYSDFIKLVGEVGGVKVPNMKMPAGAMIAMGYIYELLSKITGKPPLMTAPVARFTCAITYCDCSKAVNDLGMPQTPIRTTVEKAVNWFRENGYIKAK